MSRRTSLPSFGELDGQVVEDRLEVVAVIQQLCRVLLDRAEDPGGRAGGAGLRGGAGGRVQLAHSSTTAADDIRTAIFLITCIAPVRSHPAGSAGSGASARF
jgi:hypothetical protein